MAGLTLEKEEPEVKGGGRTGHSLAVLWTRVRWMEGKPGGQDSWSRAAHL